MRGSSSQSSKEKAPKPKYNLPHTMEGRACEWPSEDFLRAAEIYEDFHELAQTAGLTAFLHDQCDQYLLLTNTFVQNFHFHSKNSLPTVEFHLYDEHKEMSLYDFCRVCLVPFEGKTEEPHRDDVEGFIDTITVGETRKVFDARITSIHFPVYATLHYLLVVA